MIIYELKCSETSQKCFFFLFSKEINYINQVISYLRFKLCIYENPTVIRIKIYNALDTTPMVISLSYNDLDFTSWIH